MKEYLELFVPIEEVVIDDGEQYFIRVEIKGEFSNSEFFTSGIKKEIWAILFGSGWDSEDENYKVTHVLDLSKLTTKEKYDALKVENKRLESVISEARYNLPTDCPVCEEYGYDDVKFCHYRNGEGNKCLKCIN